MKLSYDSDETVSGAKPTTQPLRATPVGARLVNLAERAVHPVAETGETLIGRTAEATVMLPLKEVSRRHARIVVLEDQWVIEDLGSRNGTWLNGEKVVGRMRLTFGDSIQFGSIKAVFLFAAHDEVQERIFHMQKMDAIGRLAGGVAHDMNNILAVISLTVQGLKEDLADNSDVLPSLNDVLEVARRGGELTKNLLGFARRGCYQRERISLNKTIEDAHRLLCRTISQRVDIRLELADDLDEVDGDRNQLGQVLVNLVVNAAQAMSNRGRVTIRTFNQRLADNEIHGLAAGRYVRLEVSDTGVGMDETTQAQAFEPFFTTKAPGEGTGLGLSMVHGAVEAHGGRVTIRSAQDKGATFCIVLPALAARVEQPVRPAARQSQTLEIRGGTVLVIDDEPMLRRSTGWLLRRLGCDVLEADDGAQGLEVYRRERARITVVLLDMVMPVMDGPETFRQLRALDPDLKIVLVSGFSEEGDAEELIEAGAVAFLQKPYDFNDLKEALAPALVGDGR